MMNPHRQFRDRRVLAALLSGCLLCAQTLPALALTTITANTTWTPSSIPTPGVVWDSAAQQFVLNDSLTINANRTLSIQNGVNGGSFLLTLPNGGSLIVNSGAVINLSGVSGNGNGGNFTVNLGGTTGTINIAGTLRSNGLGTGRGGIITLNASTYTLSAGGLIEALGGGSGGQGGVINLTDTDTGMLTIPSGFTIQTNGLSTATQNLITIEADDLLMDGTLNANGTSGSGGGEITLITRNGRIRLGQNARINATGNGSGTGGTLALEGTEAGQDTDIDDCGNGTCSRRTDTETILVHGSSQIRVQGGTASNGLIRIGRSTSGNMNMNLGKIATNNFQGMSRVEFGNDGNTVNNTMSNYAVTSDFNASNPTIALYATGAISAINGNNFGNVEAVNTTGSTSITDSTGGMTVTGLTGGTGAVTLTAANTGALTVSNATSSGAFTMQTAGTITATTNNSLSGAVSINGSSGTSSRAGAVSFTNNSDTNINRVVASSANIIATGTGADMTVTNLDVTGDTTLSASQDITANATSNNFGTTTSASGRNVTLRDSIGTFTVNGGTVTGTYNVAAAAASSIAVSNVDVTGAASITSSGGGDISGTGNTFRGAATIDTSDNTNGNITMTSDFQGNTVLDGAAVSITDSAGDLTVTGLTTGTPAATLSATTTGADVNLTVTNLNTAGAGKVTVTADKNITLNGYTTTVDTLVLNSNSAGNVTVNNMVLNTGLGLTGRTTAQTGPSAGLWIGTNGGTIALSNTTVNGATDIINTGSVTGTGNTFQGTTSFNLGSGNINITASDFQSTTQNTFTAGTATIADNANGLTMTGGTITTADISTSGANPDLTISNSTFSGTAALTSQRDITATTGNNFNTVAIWAGNGNASLTDTTGGMTVSSLGGGAGTHVLTSLASGALSLQNATGSGTLTLQTDGNITATTGNNVTGAININGDGGSTDRAGTVSFTNQNNANVTRVRAANATLATATANKNLTVTNLDLTGTATLSATGNLTANDVTNNFGTTTSASGANVALYDNAGTFTINGGTVSGTYNVNAASASNIAVSNVDATGAASITSSGGGDITGSGNIFRNTANIDTNDNVAGNINLSGDFQGNTVLYGALLNLTDTAGNLTVTDLHAGVTGSTVTSAANADVAVSSVVPAAGKLTITAPNQITLRRTGGYVNTNDTFVLNSTSGGNILVDDFQLNSASLQIFGGTAAQTGPSAGIWMGTNGGSITLRNVVNQGNTNITTANGNITLGDYNASGTVNLGGTTTFSAGNGNVTGVGTFTGAVSGTAGRIGLEASSGNFTSGGLTASNATGWWAGADESLIVVTQSGDILGSGYATSGAANIRLQAGSSSSLNAANNINVSNVTSGQNLALYATGANAGNSITLGGTSSVAGHITATGLNASNQFSATPGGIDLTLSSGNLTTALVWANSGINLTTGNGSILQNTSVYSGQSTGVAGGKTVWGNGAINLTAQGGASRYINTGVMTMSATGVGNNVTARASGDSAGNGTGISVQLAGRADGNVTVTNLTSGNTTGHVYLGTSLGASLDDLEDSPSTVMDIKGTTTIKANGDVRTYGSLEGPVTITGRTLTGQFDKMGVNISNITTTATTGTGISLTALRGSLTGGNLSTAGSAHIFLQAGSQFPRDSRSNINLTNVTAGGNLNVVVAGSTTGWTNGQSVVITGSKGGTSSATKPGGGAPIGSVTMP